MTGDVARSVELLIAGTPIAQGSKRHVGKVSIESNRELLMPYRRAVASEALEAMNRREAFAGPVAVSVIFSFARPAVHYRSGKHASELKPSAPTWRASKPDLDKLLRALFDGMSGIVYRDDSQVVEVVARKQFGPPSARVRVTELLGTLPGMSETTEPAPDEPTPEPGEPTPDEPTPGEPEEPAPSGL